MPGLIVDAHDDVHPLSLMVRDLDHFKLINDSRGHQMDDRVLEQVARTLQGLCRSEDLMARVGGAGSWSYSRWRARAAYLQGGVELAVFDVERSGRPRQYDIQSHLNWGTFHFQDISSKRMQLPT